MPTSIILEGPNGSGKSTLAEKLSVLTEYPVMHASRPGGVRDAINRALNQHITHYPVIYDRSHAISRLIYQKNTISELERDLLEVCAKHLAEQFIIIYCTGHGVRITEDKPHYDEELIKETTQNQHKIRKMYDEVMDNIPHQKFNFANDEISCLQLK